MCFLDKRRGWLVGFIVNGSEGNGVAACLRGGRRVARMSVSIDYHDYVKARFLFVETAGTGKILLKELVQTDGNIPTSSPKPIEFNSKPSQLNLIQSQVNGISYPFFSQLELPYI
jgi:hypothetical protein